jgi:hypothetical protein
MSALQKIAMQERAELYFAAYPGSPAAVRRPRLSYRSGKWIALLGTNIETGLAGFGPNVESALRAFDRQYFAFLRPPKPTSLDRTA